jgi:hypothetical protein
MLKTFREFVEFKLLEQDDAAGAAPPAGAPPADAGAPPPGGAAPPAGGDMGGALGGLGAPPAGGAPDAGALGGAAGAGGQPKTKLTIYNVYRDLKDYLKSTIEAAKKPKKK